MKPNDKNIVSITQTFRVYVTRVLENHKMKKWPIPLKRCYLKKKIFSILQRDLDFAFELDFKGQLCEAAIFHDYKMR